jgi:hypothetical protein
LGYPVIIRRLGLGNTILLLPLLYVSIYLGWGLTHSLAMAMFAYFLIEGLIDTTDDNNYNLLINSVPGGIRRYVRIAIDSFIEPIGMLLGAILLYCLSESSYLLGCLFAAACLLLSLLLRSYYLHACIENLADYVLHFCRALEDWIRPSDKELYTSLLKYQGSSDKHLSKMASEALDKLAKKVPKKQLCSRESFLLSTPPKESIDAACFLFLNMHQTDTPGILKSAMESDYQSLTETIIGQLTSKAPLDNTLALAHSLNSRNLKAASHAIETLEQVSDRPLYRQFAPLIDLDISLKKKLRHCEGRGNQVASDGELAIFLQNKPWAKQSVLAINLIHNKSRPYEYRR